ncbi:LysE family translocator [Halobacillus faecis]|uniref:Amino acid transporter n=1 Tax=Halobacillus faecis TaxID=360184 RepID=A0A511WVH7_9BACI|nr:LysE family translocator [Halobacillus faecis]GEN53332.1 amino acid transporter [Halobacillus faecis]
MVVLVVSSIVLGLSIAAPVGPINIEIMRRGLAYGFWPAFCVGLGGMSSDLLLMAAMFFGIGVFLTWTWVQVALMLIGCLVLVHAGWTSLRSKEEWRLEEGPERRGHKGEALLSYIRGMIIAGTNPMNLLFWISIYGSVLSGALQEENMFRSFIISSMVFLGIGLWNANLAFFVHFGRYVVHSRLLKWIQGVASLVLIYYGIKFGWIGISTLFKNFPT